MLMGLPALRVGKSQPSFQLQAHVGLCSLFVNQSFEYRGTKDLALVKGN